MMRVILWVVTLLRVVLIPVFLWFAIRAQDVGVTGVVDRRFRYAALATLVVMGVSDLLDGWIARRFELQTQLGAVVDAVADKIVQVVLVAFFTLSVGPAFPQLPLWFLVVLFGRDLVLMVGVLMLRARYGPIQVEHRAHGRATSVTVFGVLFWTAWSLPSWGLIPLMAIASVMALVSGTVYALDGVSQARRKTASA